MRDSNGYSPSILYTKDGICFICGKVGDTARHEVFFGTGNRAKSKEHGLWVALCPSCHRQVHEGDGSFDDYLKHTAYLRFLEYNTKDDFYKLFYRYYD